MTQPGWLLDQTGDGRLTILVDARPVIRRQCIFCGRMFYPLDSWVCPTCDRARARQMALTQSKIGGV